MQLTFDVNAQTLSRTDKNNPATDSVDYLTAKFTFNSAEWNGIEKVALFKAGDVLKEAKLNASGVCVVPWEVLVKNASTQGRIYGDSNRFYVSVVGLKGTVQIPTVTVRVDLGASGYGEGTESEDPTPDLYAQYVADVKGYADSVEATAEEIRGIASGIKDSYANAFKGEASGEVVRVDDVSPVEHTVKAKVTGKNLFDISKIPTTTASVSSAYVSEVGNDYVIISTLEGYTGNGYCTVPVKIKEACPNLELGKTYILTATTESDSSNIYLPGIQKSWVFGTSMIMTEDILESTMTLYGFSMGSGLGPGACRLSNIQIEEGNVATEYTPYIDPTTVKVTRCGKNIISKPYAHSSGYTSNGVTFNVQEDGSVIINGTATATTEFIFERALTLPKGKYTYRLFGVENAPDMCSGVVNQYNGETWLKGLGSDRGSGLTFEITDTDTDYVIRTNVYILLSGKEFTNFRVSPMLCVGDKVNDYELSKGSDMYHPGADGSIDITSLSPTMTLLTDTDGVTIDLEYNRDTTAVMGDIESAVIKLNEIADSLIGGVSE